MRKIILAISALLVLLSNPLSSETIKIEAESFTSSYDVEYDVIRSAINTTCSGGYMLVGLDYPGEWVKYDLGVSAFGVYSANIRCQGDLGQSYSLRMIITSNDINDSPQSVDFNFTGKGYG